MRTRSKLLATCAAVLAFAVVGIALQHGRAPVLGAASTECTTTGMGVARATDPTATLVASVETSVAAFVQWDETRSESVRPTSPQRTRAGGERLVMCYYDGIFRGFPAPRGATADYTRMLVAVMADGSTRLVTVGPKGSVPIASPR